MAGQLTAVGLFVAATATSLPAQRRLDHVMDARLTQAPFDGAIRVEQHGTVLLDAAWGMANHDLAVPNLPHTIFRIGSLSKPLTAVAALRLVEQQVLDLDRPVCEGIEGCPADWAPVRVRDLMGHRSGIPDLFGRHTATPVEAADAGFRNILALLATELAEGRNRATLEFAPGTAYSYSNFNYVFLAYIMEQVTGRFWEDILRTEVLDPLGMDDTRYDRVHDVVRRRARGYRRADGVVHVTDYDDHEAYAAGGLLSTTRDLSRFLDGVFRGDLLRPATVEMMVSAGVGDYGLGWKVAKSFGRVSYEHTGSIRGFQSYFAYYPQEQLSVIVLSNDQAESARGMGCELVGAWLGQPTFPIGKRISANRQMPDGAGLVGTYVGSDNGDERAVRVADDGGLSWFRGRSRSDLYQLAPDSMATAADRETLIRVVRDGGAVTGLSLERCGVVVTEFRKVD